MNDGAGPGSASAGPATVAAVMSARPRFALLWTVMTMVVTRRPPVAAPPARDPARTVLIVVQASVIASLLGRRVTRRRPPPSLAAKRADASARGPGLPVHREGE